MSDHLHAENVLDIIMLSVVKKKKKKKDALFSLQFVVHLSQYFIN